jgi:glyoxylase-like metal-dependent hydrolase (beta-lactamase superfamily II)
VLHLPGHSPDSIALFDEMDGLFFAGDAIYDAMLIDDLPDSNRADYRATMRRLLDLPIRIGHGGHGPSFDGVRMREIASDYLRKTEDIQPQQDHEGAATADKCRTAGHPKRIKSL